MTLPLTGATRMAPIVTDRKQPLWGAGRAALSWLDGRRASVVIALLIALAIPSVNEVAFDGIPLDSGWEAVAFALLVPFALSASLRELLATTATKRVSWGHRALLLAAVLAIVAKLLLLGFGSDRGFTACYSATWKPPDDRCEKSYSNVLQRHDGATRIDERIDFGPSQEQIGDIVTAYALVHRDGVAATDWNLAFSNDLRFNEPPGTELSLHELMPFRASWLGTASIPEDGTVLITYTGQGRMRIGEKSVSLPLAIRTRTVSLEAASGDQPLRAEFEFAGRSPYAELRLRDGDGNAIEAAVPALAERLAAGLTSILLLASFALLGTALLIALRGDLWLLAIVAVAALLAALLSAPGGGAGFQYLAAAIAPLLVWRNPQRPVLLAYLALLAIVTAALLNVTADLDSVLYRSSGTDFLTYESFARDIVLDGSLRGGEEVFFYQPGSRYLLGLVHLLLGDGDFLVILWSLIGLVLPFAALVAWNRRRVDSGWALAATAAAGFLLLAVLTSPTTVSLVAMNASEVPSWALLPLAVAAPQLRPAQSLAWAGSAAAAALIWVMRNNQALAALTILAAIAAQVWRRPRRALVAAAAAALAVALLPPLHNLVYGQQLVLSTTSMGLVQQIDLVDLPEVFADSPIGSQIRGHVSAIFYEPPTPGLTSEGLRWLLWGLLALWGTAIAAAALRLRRGDFSLPRWLLLLLPIAYLAPHVIYQVEIYYPRHIIAGYLAMGVSSLGAFAEMGSRRAAAGDRDE
jgi:hypothetical protein